MNRICISFALIAVALACWIGYEKRTAYRDAEGHKAYLCVDNLRKIEIAKDLYAHDHGLKPGDIVPDKALVEARAWPLKCPSDGTYTINPVGTRAVCSIPGHQLP
jgi:hypothetical protein